MSNTIETSSHPLLEQVRAHVGGDVLQATLYSDSGPSDGYMWRQGGILGMFLGRAMKKKRTGGLPTMGIIAVFPDKVKVFSVKGGGMNMKPKEEAAVWDRTAIKVTAEKKRTGTKLTIESPTEGDKSTVTLYQAYDQVNDDVLRLLQDPATK